jgi:2-(1,2-epoxy-1,2-dihydrophenyl)acetyl-CoA isomerase
VLCPFWRTDVSGAVGCRAMPENAYETIEVQQRGGELRVTLDRPETMNAWNVQFGVDLKAALEQAAQDDAVRAVVITGRGRAFSSGADLRQGFEMTAAGHPDVGTPLRELYHPLITQVRTMPKPVLAAVNGPAVGIGCSLALACDLIVARESAYFLIAFVNIGLVPDGGSSMLLPERVGMARAAEMAMLGERIPAPQALEWGLVNRVTGDTDFDSEVDALAARLANGPTKAYAGIKRQFNAWMFARMEEQFELETRLQEQAAASGDFVAGVTGFLQKRAPEFKGT